MSETKYDNNNSAFFQKITEDTKRVGKGTINIEGVTSESLLVRGMMKVRGEETVTFFVLRKTGMILPADFDISTPADTVWEQIGMLWKNTSDHEKAPVLSGIFTLKEKWKLAAWSGENERGAYLRMNISPPYVAEGGSHDDGPASAASGGAAGRGGITDDGIPF